KLARDDGKWGRYQDWRDSTAGTWRRAGRSPPAFPEIPPPIRGDATGPYGARRCPALPRGTCGQRQSAGFASRWLPSCVLDFIADLCHDVGRPFSVSTV